MTELLDTAIGNLSEGDEEVSAFGVGYLADEYGYPYGVINNDLLDRATGAHKMVQNPVFPWINDPGEPDYTVRKQVSESLELYGLKTQRDIVSFIEGSMAARKARLEDGARI